MKAKLRKNTIGVARSRAMETSSTWQHSRAEVDPFAPSSAFSFERGQPPFARRSLPALGHGGITRAPRRTAARTEPQRLRANRRAAGSVPVGWLLGLLRRLLRLLLVAVTVGGRRGLRRAQDHRRGGTGAEPECSQ